MMRQNVFKNFVYEIADKIHNYINSKKKKIQENKMVGEGESMMK